MIPQTLIEFFSWTLLLASIRVKLEAVTCCWADTAGFDKQKLLTGLYDSAEKMLSGSRRYILH